MTDLFDLGALRRRLAEAPEAARLEPLGLQTVVLGDDALAALPRIVAQLAASRGRPGPVAILSGPTPKLYRATDLLGFVTETLAARSAVRSVTLGTSGRPVHADEETLARATRDCEGAGCLVAVGSGTVTDIGKVVAAAHGMGYVVVQTANSVNGFADDRSVLLVNGVKRTTPTTWADALVIDTDVLVAAPVEMNVSGFADLIATFTAPADWYLATLLDMDDTYSPTVVALAREQGPALLAAAPRVLGADRAALAQVAATLTLSGISMGVAGTTAPCSGMEHTVAHLLEMATMRSRPRGGSARRPGGCQQRRSPRCSGGVSWTSWPTAGSRASGCPTRPKPRPACGQPSCTSIPAAPWVRNAGAITRASSRAGPPPASASRRWRATGRPTTVSCATCSPGPRRS